VAWMCVGRVMRATSAAEASGGAQRWSAYAVLNHWLGVQHGSVVLQALAAYCVNAALLQFTAGLGDVFDLSVHPMAGRVGLRDYDVYKNVSALLMALHKFGALVLLAPLLCFVVQRLPWPGAFASERAYARVQRAFHRADQSPHRHALTVVLLFLFCSLNLGYYFQSVTMSKGHSFDASVAFVCAMTVHTAVYASYELFHLVVIHRDHNDNQLNKSG
jgi:hypothetical protein